MEFIDRSTFYDDSPIKLLEHSTVTLTPLFELVFQSEHPKVTELMRRSRIRAPYCNYYHWDLSNEIFNRIDDSHSFIGSHM